MPAPAVRARKWSWYVRVIDQNHQLTKEGHTMTKRKLSAGAAAVKEWLAAEGEEIRAAVRGWLQETLEQEMTEALGASKGERTPARLGYRSGYYVRTLVTRVGKLELRIPQDREGRFSTEVFERYQRSEKALVAALAQLPRLVR
jgi:putative transposase